MCKISSLDLTFFSVFLPCEAHLIEASCSLSKWASPLEFQGQPLATLALLSSGSASKFSRVSSVFCCQMTLSSNSSYFFLLVSPSPLRKSSSKKSAETFFFWRLSRGTLAWQNLFGASKFSIVETFSSCCLNRVLRVLGRLHPFLLQQNKDVVIDIYFFFLLPWFRIQGCGKVLLCCCEAFGITRNTCDSVPSVEQLVTVHPRHVSAETLWDDAQSYYLSTKIMPSL